MIEEKIKEANVKLNKLDKIVPTVTTTEMYPALSSARFQSSLITGQATPNIASGNPKLINAK